MRLPAAAASFLATALFVAQDSRLSVLPAALFGATLAYFAAFRRSADTTPFAWAISPALQTGVLLAAIGHIGVSVSLVTLGCFAMSWSWLAASGVAMRDRSKVHMLLAAILTAAAFFLSNRYPARSAPRNAAAQSRTTPPPPADPKQQGSKGAGPLHSGIRLLPEIERHITLIAPPAIARRQGMQHGPAVPTSIPFTGEYAIYYWWLLAPPKNALVTRGTPAEFRFTNTDGSALAMQARQKLGRSIDVRCCSRIDLTLLNEDLSSRAVAIEVLLIDSTSPTALPESLGRSGVTATRLQFPLLKQPRLRTFDEVRVIFHLLPPRSNRSAQIAIERLYFVQRMLE